MFGDMSAVKLPGEAKQNDLPHERGQPAIDAGEQANRPRGQQDKFFIDPLPS
jgi:hypothetical protein